MPLCGLCSTLRLAQWFPAARIVDSCCVAAVLQAWDPEESRKERELEHRRKEERARRIAEKKAAAQARLARMEAAEAEAAAAAAAAAVGTEGAAGAGAGGAPDGTATEGPGSRLKRRRTASVDYQALNAQLEAAAATARGAGESDTHAGAAEAGA